MDELTFAYYPVFWGYSRWRDDPSSAYLDAMTLEVEGLFKEWSDRVAVRGVYSTKGLRQHTDLMMWWVAHSAEDIQDLVVAFHRTDLGRSLNLGQTFLGAVRPAEFTKDHLPAFLKGEPAKRYLCVYPFVRTPEWYLLPPEERAGLLREHGEMGREFPDVLANTTSAFGLGDWEWILAFEADDLSRLVDCIRRLRDAKARLYTKVETPFVTGIRKDLADAVRDLA